MLSEALYRWFLVKNLCDSGLSADELRNRIGAVTQFISRFSDDYDHSHGTSPARLATDILAAIQNESPKSTDDLVARAAEIADAIGLRPMEPR